MSAVRALGRDGSELPSPLLYQPLPFPVRTGVPAGSGALASESDRDHRSEAPLFAPGDRVWLSTRNLPLRLLCRKLGLQFGGAI